MILATNLDGMAGEVNDVISQREDTGLHKLNLETDELYV